MVVAVAAVGCFLGSDGCVDEGCGFEAAATWSWVRGSVSVRLVFLGAVSWELNLATCCIVSICLGSVIGVM